MKRLLFALLFITAGMTGNFNLLAQTSTGFPVPEGNLSETELREIRSAYLNFLNRNNNRPLTVRSFSAYSDLNLQAAARNAFALQLKNVLPTYVPFSIAPPNSALAGVGTENPWSGFTPYRLNGNIIVYPNDPTNGYARAAVGTFAGAMGSFMPGWQNSRFLTGFSAFNSPFGGVYNPFFFPR